MDLVLKEKSDFLVRYGPVQPPPCPRVPVVVAHVNETCMFLHCEAHESSLEGLETKMNEGVMESVPLLYPEFQTEDSSCAVQSLEGRWLRGLFVKQTKDDNFHIQCVDRGFFLTVPEHRVKMLPACFDLDPMVWPIQFTKDVGFSPEEFTFLMEHCSGLEFVASFQNLAEGPPWVADLIEERFLSTFCSETLKTKWEVKMPAASLRLFTAMHSGEKLYTKAKMLKRKKSLFGSQKSLPELENEGRRAVLGRLEKGQLRSRESLCETLPAAEIPDDGYDGRIFIKHKSPPEVFVATEDMDVVEQVQLFRQLDFFRKKILTEMILNLRPSEMKPDLTCIVVIEDVLFRARVTGVDVESGEADVELVDSGHRDRVPSFQMWPMPMALAVLPRCCLACRMDSPEELAALEAGQEYWGSIRKLITASEAAFSLRLSSGRQNNAGVPAEALEMSDEKEIGMSAFLPSKESTPVHRPSFDSERSTPPVPPPLTPPVPPPPPQESPQSAQSTQLGQKRRPRTRCRSVSNNAPIESRSDEGFSILRIPPNPRCAVPIREACVRITTWEEAPQAIFLQEQADFEKYDLLQRDLSTKYQEGAKLTRGDLTVGLFCVVNSKDGDMHRGVLVDVSHPSRALVRLVDLGRVEEVSKDWIFRLHPEHANDPAMAFPVQLSGVSVPPGAEVTFRKILEDILTLATYRVKLHLSGGGGCEATMYWLNNANFPINVEINRRLKKSMH